MKQDENEQNYKKIRTTPVVGKKPYGKSQLKDRGVDIKVTNAKYSRPFLIETKGTSSSKSSCENAFVHSLGQIVTRMKGPQARYYYGLALPKLSAKIALRRVSYQFAVGMCLHIFSVEGNGTVKWYKPEDIKKIQLAKSKN
jgi:hypothetical protein